jgi:predicted nucleotidyltransferase
MIFNPEQVDAMRTLARIWSAERFVLIGASALGCFLEMSWRQTRDLDLALAVGVDKYPAGLETESGWSRHPTLEQRWIAPGAVYLDIIPVGDEQPNPPLLIWPKSGFQMSLLGMRLAFELGVRIEAAPSLAIRVAPLEVLAVLKMVGYLDRPNERERDLEDIAYILNDYVADADERRYGDQVLDLELTYDEVSSFLLGTRLAAIVNEDEREAVLRFMSLVKQPGEPTSTQARMLLRAPPNWRRNPEELLIRVAAFERGFAG